MSVFSSFKPTYNAKPIGSVGSLARALQISEAQLINYARHRDALYDRFDVAKSDGTFRKICNPKRGLKFIQKRINRAVFDNVTFPPYLFGGIKGRDYVQNAKLHADAQALIALDIRNFYPSITTAHVRNVYKYFCKFPEPVVEILTQLTTLDGTVPQGACTSSNLANLIFFESEPLVAESLADRKFTYSRLLDDISVSCQNRVFGHREQEKIIKSIAGMLHMHGMHLKNQKTRTTTRGNPEQLMEVTGLWLNRGQPRVMRAERIDIRREARKISQLFKISREASAYHDAFNRASGRVAKLAHLQHLESEVLRNSLRNMLPHLALEERFHLARKVESIRRTARSRRGTLEYMTRYYKALYSINILKRSHRAMARRLEGLLATCRPTTSREKIIYG